MVAAIVTRYGPPSVLQSARAATGPQDVVVDCVGDTTPGQAREMLVTGGAFCRVVAGLDAAVLAGRQGAAGPLRPHVGASFPFARIAEAHALCDSGRKRGNAVVLVGADQTPA